MAVGPVVAILSPGDMGHAVGAVLRQRGVHVVACLEGRSERTRELAQLADIEAVPDLETMVRESDIVLSILVPAQALGAAEQVAAAIRTARSGVLFADCNAVSPGTARKIGEVIVRAGGRFVDAGIIGSPPPSTSNRIYASGPDANELAQLASFGLSVRVLNGGVGRASGLKMCYAALTKGLQALGVELLMAARVLGVEDQLRIEQEDSMAPALDYLRRGIPSMPPKAGRWVGEMEEIARTFGELGLTSQMFEGVADMYRVVAQTSLGHEAPETRDTSRDLDAVIEGLADELELRHAPRT